MDLNQTEIRRELRAADAQNAAALPRWREMLHRTFGDPGTSTTDKAQLLGLPDRRGFLRIGGVTIAGTALLAACGDDDTVATQVGGPTGDGNMDVVLANTAISLETLAIDTYVVAAESGLVQRAVMAEAAGLFMEHHAAHRDALISTVGRFNTATVFPDPFYPSTSPLPEGGVIDG